MQYTRKHHLEISAQAAGAVIFDAQNRVVLVREKEAAKQGLWHIPSGRLEPNEFPQQAALREVREETGLDIQFAGFLNTYVGCFEDGALVLRHVFLARLPDHATLTPEMKTEIAEARLFTLDEVNDLYHREQLRMHQTWLMIQDGHRLMGALAND